MSLQDNEAGLKTLLQKYQTIDTSIQSQDWLLVLFLTNGVYVVYFGLTRCLISVKKTIKRMRMRICCQTNTAVVYISLALWLWYYYEHEL